MTKLRDDLIHAVYNLIKSTAALSAAEIAFELSKIDAREEYRDEFEKWNERTFSLIEKIDTN